MVYFYLALSVMLVAIATKILIRQRLSGADIYLVLYMYFFSGPIIVRSLGYEPYSGIRFEHVELAIYVFYISILAFILGLALPMNVRRPMEFYPSIGARKVFLVMLPILSAVMSIVGMIYALKVGSLNSGLDKVQKLAAVGIVHYVIVTLIPCITIAYMALTHRKNRSPVVFYVSLLLYAMYSISMGERDFILLLIPIYFWAIRRVYAGIMYPAVFSLALAFVFVMMSSVRAGIFSQGLLSSFLNQGSNLMIITNVIHYLQDGGGHIFGGSYLSALISAVSAGVINLWEPRSVWFSEYFSSGLSAYGFSLEAEAYLNFGMIGVFGVFFLLARYYCYIESLAKSGSHLGLLMYYHFLFFVIYAIRGEFLVVVKSLVYCLFFFVLVSILSSNGLIRVFSARASRDGVTHE